MRLGASRDHWRSVNGTHGAIRLITEGKTRQPIPVGAVKALQARMSTDGTINWAPLLNICQTVWISDEPFADFVGTLERLDAAGRVCVLLYLMGRAVSVSMRSEMLAPAV